ncbi:sensor histidine kinase [Aliikangiella coralliicola]|uniref:histidine kinase n=1 Tax=Aliikangiella coralliicola TaxID=2592383 RepID=A0A545U0B0_9GAMM|nr:HAMP domain-containing sensor histidine kinase [Aliikangiella coralliicola]TQV82902.1 HAMP domain-containing histidine kinase [Aliikangiella coralliicola]
MNKDNNNLFSIILASTVHDMKNSLGMMLDALNSILAELPVSQQGPGNTQYGIVQYESSRVNNSLMQLLALYKIENNQLPFNPSYHHLYDFIEEQILEHSPLLDAKGFSYKIDIDESLEVVFDEALLAMVISNIIGNAIRYAHSEILLTAEIDDGVTINICDDGPGYPAQMIELSGNYIQGINQSTGSTGLGLFFAQKIAIMHRHGNKTGHVELANGGPLGGGVFKITLP